MLLYHISTNTHEENPKQFVPRVPASANEPEDVTTPRICFAPSVLLAAQATGYGLTENDEIMVYELDTKTVNPENIIRPERLYRDGLVPDADETGEHWITEPVTLCGTRHLIDDIEWYGFGITSLSTTEIKNG